MLALESFGSTTRIAATMAAATPLIFTGLGTAVAFRGLLKARLDADEVVTTLMMNFIAVAIATWLVNRPLLAVGSANSATPMVAEAARLPRLMRGSPLNAFPDRASLRAALLALGQAHCSGV